MTLTADGIEVEKMQTAYIASYHSQSCYLCPISLSCYQDMGIPIQDITPQLKKTLCPGEKKITEGKALGAPVLIDFIYLLNIYAADIRAKKSKVAFKSVGIPRRNLSAAYSALTSFYSREKTANCRTDDLWFDNCFRTRKPLALHWTGTSLLYFFSYFQPFTIKKNYYILANS